MASIGLNICFLEESEDGDADLHQCGHCRQMFTNLSLYITHKIEKPCRAGLVANRDEWSNEAATAFSGDVINSEDPASNRSANLSNELPEKDADGRNLSQESQKRKHDRKGPARRLNVTGSPDSVGQVLSPDNVSKLDDTQIPTLDNSGENPVIVVLNESGAEKEANIEPESRLGTKGSESGRRELNKSRHPSANVHQPSFKSPSITIPTDMPFLERINVKNSSEGNATFSGSGFPNFPPRITDKMQTVYPTHTGDVARDYPIDRLPVENHIEQDMRKSWTEVSKKNLKFSSHLEADLHACYPPPLPPHHMYNSPLPGIPYPNPYMRHSSMAKLNKPCCSTEHSVGPHYPVGRYSMSPASAERVSRKMYEIDPSLYSIPYSKAHERLERRDQDGAKSPSIKAVSKQQQQPQHQSSNNQSPNISKPAVDNEDADSNTEKTAKDAAPDKTANINNESTEEHQASAVTDAPPQLVKIAHFTSKENFDSPSSSARPESYETNSQTGSYRSRDSTPTSLISDSPRSSNQSIDPTISPSQVYEGGVLRIAPDVNEDASKQSMDSESQLVIIPDGKQPAAEISGSPNSERYASEAGLEERDDSVKQERGVSGHHVKRPRSEESNIERGIEEITNEASSPPSDPSWRHSKQVYRCPLCAKIFPFKSKLQRHVLVHTGIKPYKCNVCGRGFTQQIDLQRHLTRHTGEKPFKCHLCKAQFIRADNLRKHAKDTHFVNIEEPIRKRRRKTTGSDTVLPPLEVAIAMAINETEKNGGRVLGRSSNRTGRSSRRDRLLSMEEDQRRIEQSPEAFSRPTMGSIPSHQFPGGPPSMGFPHVPGPSVAPFSSRHPPEIYDPTMNERSSSSPPSHQILPPRYHPGSMVFQPRSMPDRYMDRPFFNRDLPAMYWSSPPRHAHISPSEERSRGGLARERFNSEASEGSSSVFDSRDDGKMAPEGGEESMVRREESMVRREETASDARFSTDRPRMHSDRNSQASESRLNEERIALTPDRITMAGTTERDMHHLSDPRSSYTAEERSPLAAEEKFQHQAEKNHPTEDRIWSMKDRMRAAANPVARSYENAVFRMPDEPRKQDDVMNRSPQMIVVTQSDHKQLSSAARFQDAAENPVPLIEAETAGLQQQVMHSPPQQQDVRNSHLRITTDPWSRYERSNLNVSPKNSSYHQEGASSGGGGVSKDGQNGFRTPHEEFVSS
eukprot:gene6321-7045_t